MKARKLLKTKNTKSLSETRVVRSRANKLLTTQQSYKGLLWEEKQGKQLFCLNVICPHDETGHMNGTYVRY